MTGSIFARGDGDSGGPVFSITSGGNAILRGIFWGSDPFPFTYADGLISPVYQILEEFGDLAFYDPGPMGVNIDGPSSMTSSQTCTWTANIVGGMRPITAVWSGVLSDTMSGTGNGASILKSGTVTSSGYLYLHLTDYYNRTANTSFYVTVDPNAQNNCIN